MTFSVTSHDIHRHMVTRVFLSDYDSGDVAGNVMRRDRGDTGPLLFTHGNIFAFPLRLRHLSSASSPPCREISLQGGEDA